MTAMLLQMASSTGAHTLALQRKSFEIEVRERALSHTLILRSKARTPLKLPNEPWRAWSPEAFHCADFNHLHLLQPSRLLGFCSRSLQANGSSAFSHPDDTEFSEAQKMPCSTRPRHADNLLQAVPCIGRALLFLCLGLGLSMPALARTVAPPASTVASGNDTMQKDEVIMKQEYVKGDVTQRPVDDSRDSISNPVDGASSNLNTSEILDEQLRLSENFWKGVPTPEGSYLYNLKIQLDMYPRDSMALEALLRAVMEQRDMLRALTVLETLLDIQPSDLKWKFLKARTHEYLGELLMAKLNYEELLALQPLSARYLQGLSMLLKKLGEETEALKLIQRALESACLENKYVEARNVGVLLSQFHIQLGNFEDALQHLSSMIEEDPDDFRPYLCQGLAYALMDEIDKANQSFKKYRQLCPPDAFDHSYLDSLMLKAHTDKQTNTFMQDSMKATSRNRKKAKPMKQPSFAEKLGPDEEDLLESR